MVDEWAEDPELAAAEERSEAVEVLFSFSPLKPVLERNQHGE